MAVLVFADSVEGKLKKPAREAAHYAGKIAADRGTEAIAVAMGEVSPDELAALGKLGVSKVLHASDERLSQFDSTAFTKVIAAAQQQTNADVVVLPFNHNGKAIGPRLSVRLKAGLVPGAVDLPREEDGEFIVRKNVFSGKALAHYVVSTPVKIVSLNPNSVPVEESAGEASVETFSVELFDSDFGVQVKERQTVSAGQVPLAEAELVVSGGRGLKGPENWDRIEEMAELLGAATACSRAVADVGWRPHHEHVGQTGLTIQPNLYIAIAISGAIQHLAGVNNSKYIVVINIDPEAPFFKAADYGIIGDAFEVVPKLNAALKQHMAVHQ